MVNDRYLNYGVRRSSIVRALVFSSLIASSGAAVADDIRVETIRSNLRSPAGIAIRSTPGAAGYDIYIAELGTGRVIRLSSGKPNDSEEAITGFIASTDDDDLYHLPGPHALLFLDPNRLVVAGSEGKDRPFVRLYELADVKTPLSAERHEQQAALATGEEKIHDNVTSFQSLARTLANDKVPDALVLGAVTKDGSAAIWRLPVRSGTLGELSPLDMHTPARASQAVAIEPRGHIVVVRPDGGSDSPTSRMEFINPIDGRPVADVSIRLPHIVGIAYSPRTGNLYAVSQSSQKSNPSGVYRIDMGESRDPSNLSAIATRIAQVPRPTALAFGPDGVLYVTSSGSGRNNGLLRKIGGNL